jgi:GNAT superfamily N-acetyltransferase
MAGQSTVGALWLPDPEGPWDHEGVTTHVPTLREVAEAPDHYISQVPPPARRIIAPNFTLIFSPSSTASVTSHLRTTVDKLDDTIAEVRRHLRDAGFTGNVWQITASSRPEGLGRLLAERGFVPATRPPYEPRMTAMVLQTPPAITASEHAVEVRLVSNIEEFREVIRLAMEIFNESPEDAAGWFEAVPALWASHDGVSRYTHVALLDGRPVGFGFAVVCGTAVLLGGSGVLESARGRGVYRALVAARWQEAARLGHSGLIIQAGAMSRPILERCGFEAVSTIEQFDDVSLASKT